MSIPRIITCSLTPANIREFKRMKVVRPEWFLESVNVGYLSPWKVYICVRKELTESTQGTKISQISLLGQPSEPGAALSTDFIQTVPKAVFQSKEPEHVQDPLYTTDLETKLMLIECPCAQPSESNPIHWQMSNGNSDLLRDILRTPVSVTSRRGIWDEKSRTGSAGSCRI